VLAGCSRNYRVNETLETIKLQVLTQPPH